MQSNAKMIACSSLRTCPKHVLRLSRRLCGQMGRSICDMTPSCACFHVFSGYSRPKYIHLNGSEVPNSVTTTGFKESQGGCFGSCISKHGRVMRSLVIGDSVGGTIPQKGHFSISTVCDGINAKLLFTEQGMPRKVRYSVRRFSWPRGHASAGLLLGLLVCYSSLEPVHAEAANDNGKEGNCKDLSCAKLSHGKKVYSDYSVTGIPGDGRCLFRSVAHGACLRSGRPAPSESLQRELADELRGLVADEFIKRREETEWFVEGDFDTYVSQMRKPHVWGGEPELLMASHVLRMPITVYMYDKDAGGLISIAEYGQEYDKENPIRVLYHGSGHYDTLLIPGKKDVKSGL
ncbi:OVARIAN TUMOR DOMAIN-containing deubiquitinating enzyme 4 isoform X2 [Rhodamnia argentea]|uniref:Ubiquitin thioesterase OTU n=1 Tax=Rhodamnia argentea TaxID=178133 RepID=A0ABM3HZR3_9MYRT|nr:OVARIAN TUMOR DOMAIN-containing deubiquitinating enzyme 4 isoform X2 [Rhodamnia argentea]